MSYTVKDCYANSIDRNQKAISKIKALDLYKEAKGFIAAAEFANSQMQEAVNTATYFDDLASIRRAHKVLVFNAGNRAKQTFSKAMTQWQV